jgi:signal transduction histidine kinase
MSGGGSLRRRISFAIIGITSLIVAVNGFATWMTSRALLINGVDREVAAAVRRMESDQGSRLPRRVWTGPARPESRGTGPLLIEVSDATGRTLFHSSALEEPQTLVGCIESPTPTMGTLPDGRIVRGQILTIATIAPERRRPVSDPAKTTVEPPPPVLPLTVRIAFDLTRQANDLRQNAWVLAGMWLIATALAWGADLLVRSTVLKPLNRLSAAIDVLGPNDLAARLPADSGPAEVRGVVGKLNNLLDRLHQAFTREQGTIANIAHELRTPVAALRTDLEFRLLVATDPAERNVLTACMGTVLNMQNQVANLLLLARLEAGREPLAVAELDLVELVQERVERCATPTGEAPRDIGCNLPHSLVLPTSRAHVTLLVDNLLGNARAHGLPDQPIQVRLEQDADSIRLAIANPYRGKVDPEALGKPYYRSDDARHDGAHSGLGLSLCLRLSRLLGGTLEFTTAEQVFVATVRLPAAPAA